MMEKSPRPRVLHCWVWMFWWFVLPANASFGGTYPLVARQDTGQGQVVQVLLEVRGELKLNAEGRGTRSLPLEVDAKLHYQERFLDFSDDPWRRRSVRHYDEAFASIKAGGGLVNRRLDPDHRTILVEARGGAHVLFSPRQPLRREQVELLDVLGSSLLIDHILPQRAVNVGEQWNVDSDALAGLFSLEVVTENDAVVRLASVEDDVALIEIEGRIGGSIGGVASDIDFKARCNFDLRQQRLTWYAVSLREKRAIGHAQPGFEVTARLRMVLEPAASLESLSDEKLARLPPDDAASRLLIYQPERSYYRLIHDRRWHAMIDRHDLSVLRLVDRGELVAQCNISELPDLEPGQHLALKEFQSQIRHTLRDRFGQFIEATQSTGEDGRRVLRVVVAGSASEVPIQWIYYHISDPQGRRAAIAFTLEASLAERFAEADRKLVESFQFAPRPQQAQREATDSPARL